jgi:aminodeoxyfutalosine deaminase
VSDPILELPKAELHLHLEGAVEPETLHEIDPATPVEEFRALYSYADFDGFLKAFGAVGKRLATPEAYGIATRRLLERLAAQHVRYAEIMIAAGVVLWKGQEFGPVFDAISDAAKGSPVEVRWILDAVRQFPVEHGMQVAQWAAERLDCGVVAIGIGGSEERGPALLFKDVFAFAKSAGLRLVAHAGEGTTAQSIWDALSIGAERIGHGISAVEDRMLMAHLRERDIPLEISITSNLVTRVVKRVEDHPVRTLYESGVPIVLNTDDPAMFGCTLVGEYRLAAEQFGFTDTELRELAANAFKYSFANRRQAVFPTA